MWTCHSCWAFEVNSPQFPRRKAGQLHTGDDAADKWRSAMPDRQWQLPTIQNWWGSFLHPPATRNPEQQRRATTPFCKPRHLVQEGTMAKITQISSSVEFADLLQTSRIVVADCEYRTPHPRHSSIAWDCLPGLWDLLLYATRSCMKLLPGCREATRNCLAYYPALC